MRELFERLLNKWPSELVPRSEIDAFTGGLFQAGTMANYDSRGCGPRQRVKVCGKVAYFKQDLVDWLWERCEVETNLLDEGKDDV